MHLQAESSQCAECILSAMCEIGTAGKEQRGVVRIQARPEIEFGQLNVFT
mgnify:CR=1 FL=1